MTSNDGPQETPAEARARRRAELPPPGTVQEEAALLVDLLSQRRWAPPSGMPSGRADGPAGPGAGGDAQGQEPRGQGSRGPETRGAGQSSPGGPSREDGTPHAADGRHECTCGGRTPAACSVCPVCQLIAFVQHVNPETIDKVADFVGFAATALRDLATAQRERQSDRPSGPDPQAGPEPEAGPAPQAGPEPEAGDTREPGAGSPA